jgi:hypothetical protein
MRSSVNRDAERPRFPSWRGKPGPATLLGMDSGWLVVVVVLVVVVGVALSRRSKQEAGPVAVDASPQEAVDAATSYMVGRGFALSHKSENSATFTRPKKPNNDIGCLLLLIGIIPGLLYFGLFKGTATTTVLATNGPAGTQLMISGDDANAGYTLRDWAKDTLAAPVAIAQSEREPCWKCGNSPSFADVRCPSCGAWLRPT